MEWNCIGVSAGCWTQRTVRKSQTLEEKIWNTDCADYSNRRTIYCSKGDFVEKVNIGLHEAVHLIPYLRKTYQPGTNFEDSDREQYTVVSQQRYGVPIKKSSNGGSGTWTFFPVYNTKYSPNLLKEYAEGITALIDYDDIWKRQSTWSTAEDNSNELNAAMTDKASADFVQHTVSRPASEYSRLEDVWLFRTMMQVKMPEMLYDRYGDKDPDKNTKRMVSLITERTAEDYQLVPIK